MTRNLKSKELNNKLSDLHHRLRVLARPKKGHYAPINVLIQCDNKPNNLEGVEFWQDQKKGHYASINVLSLTNFSHVQKLPLSHHNLGHVLFIILEQSVFQVTLRL